MYSYFSPMFALVTSKAWHVSDFLSLGLLAKFNATDIMGPNRNM